MELEHDEEHKYKLPDPISIGGKDDSNLFTIVNCPNCTKVIPADNINLNSELCKCGNCNAVFQLKTRIETINASDEVIRRPEGIDLMYFRDELDITLDQNHSNSRVAWLAILAPLFAFIFTVLYTNKGLPIGLALAIPSWAAFIYGLLGVIRKGKIYITIDDHFLNIKNRPKHLVKDSSYNIKDIDQLYSKMTPTGISLMMVIDGPNGEKHQQLVGYFKSLSHAKYLEQEIEKHLGIKNRKVPGEMP